MFRVTMGLFTKEQITFRKPYWIVISFWLSSWFELHVCSQALLHAVLITNRICTLRGNILFLLHRLTHACLQRAFPKCARTNHIPKELRKRVILPLMKSAGSAQDLHTAREYLFLLRRLTHACLQRAFPKCARTNHIPKELCKCVILPLMKSAGSAQDLHTAREYLFLLRRLTHACLQRAFPKCARTNHIPKELCKCVILPLMKSAVIIEQ